MNAPFDDPHIRLHTTLGGGLSVALKCDALANEHDRHFGIGKPIRVAVEHIGRPIAELAAIYFPQHFTFPPEPGAPTPDSSGLAGDSSPALPSVAASPGLRRSAFFDRASNTH